VGNFPDNAALRSIRELSLGEAGYKVARFLYCDDEAGCAVEVTWRNDATRDQVTYRFRGVVPKELWPVRFGSARLTSTTHTYGNGTRRVRWK
jgi:hypothetical protein